MKFRKTLSIAIVLSIVLVSLMSSDSTAKAQNRIKAVADTGMVTLGPNQVLRLSVVSVDGELGGGIYGIRFRQVSYTQGICNGDGVCKQSVASQSTSDPMTLMPGEAATFDIPNTAFGVRGIVETNRRNVRVLAIVFDTSTQTIKDTMELEWVTF